MLTGQQFAKFLQKLTEKPGPTAEKLSRIYDIPAPTIHGWARYRKQSQKNMELIAKVVQLCFDHREVIAEFMGESALPRPGLKEFDKLASPEKGQRNAKARRKSGESDQ